VRCDRSAQAATRMKLEHYSRHIALTRGGPSAELLNRRWAVAVIAVAAGLLTRSLSSAPEKAHRPRKALQHVRVTRPPVRPPQVHHRQATALPRTARAPRDRLPIGAHGPCEVGASLGGSRFLFATG
jgi:hypothetical protein